jgi:aminoglycoside phosphotransferase (APT) family kinase protein
MPRAERWENGSLATGTARDIVETSSEAASLEQPPLLVLDHVRTFMDERDLGAGDVRASAIGEGRSNFTFLIERGEQRFVLRRPPRPPYPPSAHDVAREARLQLALRPLRIRVPVVRAICEDELVLGVPFYVMDFIDGDVITDRLPPLLRADTAARRRVAEDLVDVLAEIHGCDVGAPALAAFARPGNYLERQVRRFTELWPRNATRVLPAVDEAGRRLATALPAPVPPTVVHGDFRLGNMIVAANDPTRIVAALDWEMGAIGDPRADVGYMLATYAEAGAPATLVGGSPATALPGFPSGAELARGYVERTGRELDHLEWFVAFALWKAAVFCEAIYGRYLRHELADGDDSAAVFGETVPLMAEGALQALATRLR